MAFNNSKIQNWDRQTLNDGDLFDDEFDRVYSNMNDLDGRVLNLNEGVSTLTQITATQAAGLIQGEIFWDQTGGGDGSVGISRGRYEVAGTLIVLHSDVSLNPVSHNYGHDDKEPEYWYYTLLDQSSNFRTQLATGDVVQDGLSINSVSALGDGEFRITFRSSPDLSAVNAGQLFRSNDLPAGNSGIFKISAVDNGNSQIQVINSRGNAILPDTNPVGAGAIYDSVSLLKTPNPAFDVARQGYYDGDWRIIGIDYFDTPRSYRWTRSYKTGFDKNDNHLFVSYFDGYDTVDTSIVKFRDIQREWGSDYSYDGSSGAAVTFHRSGWVKVYMVFHTSASSSVWRAFTINETPENRKMDSWNTPDVLNKYGLTHAETTLPASVSDNFFVTRGDVLRVRGYGPIIPVPQYQYQDHARITFTPE